MAVRWAITGGSWSNVTTWNDGATLGIPTVGDDVWTNGFTVNMDVNATVNSLNNTVRGRDIATPQMTSNNTPSPYVAAASTVFGANNLAFTAFDRNYATNTGWATQNGVSSGWVSMDFGSGNTQVIDGYTIYGTSSQSTNPRVWTLEGSSDNSSWTILHSFSGASAIAANSLYSISSIGNVQSYRYYRLNVSAVGGGAYVYLTELELYKPNTISLSVGGSFNFNTSGVTVTSGSLSSGSANLITITATGGLINLITSGSLFTNFTPLINHSGNCNLSINTINVLSPPVGINVISKSSSGTITITGNFVPLIAGQNGFTLNSTNGNTIVNGNIQGSAGISQHAIQQTAGDITVNGNVVGGSGGFGINLTGAASRFTINGNVVGGSAATIYGINFGGTLGNVNGNVTGGVGGVARSTGAHGIFTTVGGVNVTGNCVGNVGSAVVIGANSTIIGNVFAGGGGCGVIAGTNNPLTVNFTGDTYASATAAGIECGGTGTQVVNLTGNMYNTLGRNAIWCPNIFISNSATTLWRMDIGGGLTRTLYSADSFPNLPSTSNVRNLIQYGPASALTGTMIVASPSDIRRNVLTDNTVGTADITAQDILNFINTSSDPLAIRMRTMLTDNSAGQLISEYNFV